MSDNIKETSLPGLVTRVIELQSTIEDSEAEIQVTKDEIRDRLAEMKVDGTKVGDYLVKTITRPVFTSVLLSEAEQLGAIKKAVDLAMLAKLHKKGVKINNVKIVQYVSIKEVS